MTRSRLALVALLAVAAGLALWSRHRAAAAAEAVFGPADPHGARTVSLVRVAPRPGAAPRLVWRVGFESARRWAAVDPADTAFPARIERVSDTVGLYVTPLGRPVGVFPAGMRWH